MTAHAKFSQLNTEHAPGQEVRQGSARIESLLKGAALDGVAVDFSHGDVDAHPPAPAAFAAFSAGIGLGGRQAYTEYRGASDIRQLVGRRLAAFTGAPVDADEGLIITPGAQGALFLAAAATISKGDKVAVVEPDYFANRKIVAFLEGEVAPVRLDYCNAGDKRAGLDLGALKTAFEAGARTFIFSNPNNPTGAVYSSDEIRQIAHLAAAHGATVIVDQLYSRLLYAGTTFTHLRALDAVADNVITIFGPSKTESLSGYRLGVAVGPGHLVGRMEQLQAIVSLRAAGYSQAVLRSWFDEPAGWLDDRIARHQAIRDDLMHVLGGIAGVAVRCPQAGSYLFPQLPLLAVSPLDFVRILRAQAGVIATPGSEFGPDSGASLRLNFSQDHAAAVAAVQRLAILVDRYKA